MKLCEILSATHTHAGQPHVRGDRIEVDDAVAAHFAGMVPPVLKVIAAAKAPVAAPKQFHVKKGS